jgi:hypothetical protein
MAAAKSIQSHPPEGHRDDVRECSPRPKGLGHDSVETLAPGAHLPRAQVPGSTVCFAAKRLQPWARTLKVYAVLSLLSYNNFLQLATQHAGHTYLNGNHGVVTWQTKIKMTERAFKN